MQFIRERLRCVFYNNVRILRQRDEHGSCYDAAWRPCRTSLFNWFLNPGAFCHEILLFSSQHFWTILFYAICIRFHKLNNKKYEIKSLILKHLKFEVFPEVCSVSFKFHFKAHPYRNTIKTIQMEWIHFSTFLPFEWSYQSKKYAWWKCFVFLLLLIINRSCIHVFLYNFII